MAKRTNKIPKIWSAVAAWPEVHLEPATPWGALKLRVRSWQRKQELDRKDFEKDHLDAYGGLSRIVNVYGNRKGV